MRVAPDLRGNEMGNCEVAADHDRKRPRSFAPRLIRRRQDPLPIGLSHVAPRRRIQQRRHRRTKLTGQTGGFWQLFQTAPYGTSVRVLNNILNHGARSRVRSLSRLRAPDLFEGLSAEGDVEGEENGAVLDLDGTPRLYVGDSHVWSWYRGTSVGPYPGMSALPAMERLAEGWLAQGCFPGEGGRGSP